MNSMAKKLMSHPEAGFTYIGMLAFLMVLLLWSTAAMEVSRTLVQRDKESELIFIGHQYRFAIKNFYFFSGRFPMSLNELENFTPKADQPRRFLRKIYRDPMTDLPDWGVVRNPNGSIVGVYSLSEKMPIKQKNFENEDALFMDSKKYSDWKFVVSNISINQ